MGGMMAVGEAGIAVAIFLGLIVAVWSVLRKTPDTSNDATNGDTLL